MKGKPTLTNKPLHKLSCKAKFFLSALLLGSLTLIIWHGKKSGQFFAGKGPSVNSAASQDQGFPIADGATDSVPPNIVPDAEQVKFPQEMLENLSTNLEQTPNVLWPSRKWPPYERDLYLNFSRRRLEIITQMPLQVVRTKCFADLFEYFPNCNFEEIPPTNRQQAKQEYIRDVEIMLEFLKFLDLPSCPKTTLQALNENRVQENMTTASIVNATLHKLHDEVFLADQLEGGTRFRDAYLEHMDQALQFDRSHFFEQDLNWDDSGPETELGQKVAKVLEALKEK